MQWLFDIVLDMVWKDIYAKGIYRNRGDPDDFDYSIADFIKNDNWIELDLSHIVPENAKCVLLRLAGRADVTGAWFMVRRHGNINEFAIGEIRTQVASVFDIGIVPVSLDSDRKIDYRIKNVTWQNVFMVVCGWWL